MSADRRPGVEADQLDRSYGEAELRSRHRRAAHPAWLSSGLDTRLNVSAALFTKTLSYPLYINTCRWVLDRRVDF